jgi:hypothetical protein
MNKICPICNKEFVKIFKNQKTCSFACSKILKEEYIKKYCLINKEKRSKYNKKHYQKNKKKVLKRTEKYYKTHKEQHAKSMKKWYESNKIKVLLRQRELYELNKEKKLIQNRNWERLHRKERNEKKKYRLKTDILFRIKTNMRARIQMAVKYGYKSEATMKLVGCSIEFLKKHLESKFKPGMSWNNYGKWHIDHIKPCASFDLNKPKEQHKCFHYTNLQPLWAKENSSKGAK